MNKDLTLVIKSGALKTHGKDTYLFAIPVDIVDAYNIVMEKFTAAAVDKLELYYYFPKQQIAVPREIVEIVLDDALGEDHGTLTISNELFQEIVFAGSSPSAYYKQMHAIREENKRLRELLGE